MSTMAYIDLRSLAHSIGKADEFKAFENEERREKQRRRNGRKTGYDRAWAEREKAVVAQVAERFQASRSRPITERVPEYVIRYDENGDYAGLELRT